MKTKVLFVVGPTAVGKTDMAIYLAKELRGEIISADSMQIYRHMNIGTAKPTLEEQEGIPHHLIDCIEPNESFTVAEFQRRAKDLINEITSRGKLPIVAGGTGLYVNSLLYKMDFTSSVSNWQLRSQLEEEAKTLGPEYLHNRLKELDLEAAERIHPNNIKRVIRALEVNLAGERMGDFRSDILPEDDYDSLILGLTRDREELYERVNQRVDLMLDQGLIEEVQSLLERGYSEDLTAFKGLGYKEIIAYLKGRWDLAGAIDILKRDTRRYAKRQLTWFKRYNMIKWYNLSHYPHREKLFAVIMQEVEGHFNFLSNK